MKKLLLMMITFFLWVQQLRMHHPNGDATVTLTMVLLNLTVPQAE